MLPPDGESRLHEIETILDLFPSEMVKEALINAGAPVLALDAMVDVARNADDPRIREDVRRAIEDRGLGLALHSNDDDPDWGSSLNSGD